MDTWLKTGIATAALAAAGWAGLSLVPAALRAPAQVLTSADSRRALAHCTEGAMLFHDVRWAAACMVVAEQDVARHAACLEDPAIMADPKRGQDHCDRTFGMSDDSPECTLPPGQAAHVNALLRDEEKRCAAEARAGR
ncbi:MAG TPA: hypothetical protein VLJ58_15420 [Ramlibacter sp.]|nr:hypothetical protein [Ramlibacter sp.]